MRSVLSAILPHLIKKEPIPDITNPSLLASIEELKNCSSVEHAMKSALEILASKFKSKRLETYLLLNLFFEKDPNKLWERTGFMHCTHQNFLFRVLLVRSGWLREEQIELAYSLVYWVSPHQFLKIKLPHDTVAIDPWNYIFGAAYGKYAIGFGVRTL
jgi:hypothetical protein